MNPIEQLSNILPALNATVDGIEPMQMNNATPCSKFTVHDVLDHMIVLGDTFGYTFRGEQAPEITPPAVHGIVPSAQFRDVMDGLLAAVKFPEAMERTVSTPLGEMPGETFARLVAFDGLMHGWDLATSTGQTFDVTDDVIAAVDQFARAALTPEMRDGDTFKDETVAPEGASSLARLAAFSGRTV